MIRKNTLLAVSILCAVNGWGMAANSLNIGENSVVTGDNSVVGGKTPVSTGIILLLSEKELKLRNPASLQSERERKF